MTDLKQAAREFAARRRTGFNTDRTKTIGASDIGRCARAVRYAKLGTPVDDGYQDTNGFAERGNGMEDAYTAPLLTYWVEQHGGVMKYATQGNQQTLATNLISATPDGVAVGVSRTILAPYGVPDIGPSRCLVVEMKSISPLYSKKKLPKAAHVPQVYQQLLLTRSAVFKETCPTTGEVTDHSYQPEYGVVVYVNSDDWWDIEAFPVKWDDARGEGLLKRAWRIMGAKDPNELSPEGKVDGGSECRTCAYSGRCLGYSAWLQPFEVSPKDKKEKAAIAKLATQIAKKEAAAVAVKVSKAKLEEAMYARLAKNKTRYFKSGGVVVRAKETASQNRTDAKKLVALAMELGATTKQIEACKSPTKPGTSLEVEVA